MNDRSRRALRLATCVAVLVLLAACQAPRTSLTPQLFVLAPLPPTAPLVALPDVTLAVGPVAVADYLDQPQLVLRRSEHEVAHAAAGRWAMPLSRNLAQFMRSALEQRLEGVRTVDFPALDAAAFDVRVAIEITRLDGSPDGEAVLDASWRLMAAGESSAIVATRGTRRAARVAEASLAALVAAESALLGQLADDIAAALRDHHR